MGGSAGASEKYNDQMAQAALQMESINSLYTKHNLTVRPVKLKSIKIRSKMLQNLKEQMESLASNLSSLNGVYGGMLSAMNKK